MLGYNGNFDWKPNPEGGIVVTIPPIPINRVPCKDVWVLKLEGLKN